MTPKFKAKIKAAINKLRRQWPPIIAVKKAARVGPELFRCSGCGDLVYAGARDISYIQIHHPEARVDKIEIDHVSSVQPLDGRELTFDEYIDRVFCDESNLMALCKSGCHQSKSAVEASERAEYRRKKK
jgi:hypothetical protein